MSNSDGQEHWCHRRAGSASASEATGQGKLRQRYIARRKSVSFFEDVGSEAGRQHRRRIKLLSG
ncbi:Uncharacterised protein [Bacillus freudenreichii]|nr:Uncharacterised protein [Bacillus freudenreichii]